jgi:tetratricopeptide (TPR) repeat protein
VPEGPAVNYALILTIALVSSDPADPAVAAGPPAADFVDVPALAERADRSYLVRRWDRAIEGYQTLVKANPTVGYYWYRLGYCRLGSGQFEEAIPALTKAHELGAYTWRPVRMIYRGEAAWGIAACYARLGKREEAFRWTRTALAEGLRDIRKFHEFHFLTLLKDDEYRKLVWLTDAKKLSRDEGFRHDVRFLMHEAKRIHYDPFRSTSEAELDSMAAALEADIPKLTDEQILVRMMAIVRRLGDGHTQVWRNSKPAWLGVQMFRYPEGLYVESALPENAQLVGAKVLRIGDRSAEEALRLVEDIASRDNEMTVQWFSASMLASHTVLRGLGIHSGEGPVPLEIEDAQGKTRKVELAVSDKNAHRGQWVHQVPGCQQPLPWCRKSPGKMYWFETLPQQKLVYFQMNGVGNDTSERFDKFCTRLFEAVERPEIEALVIDMRYNGGGDTFTNVPLIEGLIRCEKIQQPGKLFVIIGRRTFSAAQNTTSELERRTKAILVGEPTGSNPNFIGESIRVVFPYSGWAASISDLWWQHSMSMDYRVWTHPQLYAPPTATALRAHRDPAMEMVEQYRAQATK